MRFTAAILAACVVLSAAQANSSSIEEGTEKAVISIKKQAVRDRLQSGFIPLSKPSPAPGLYSCGSDPLAAPKQTGSYPCEAIPPLQEAPPLSEALKSCKAALKSLLGPFLILITDSAPYAEAAALPPLLPSLPPDVAAPLNQQWAAIESLKSSLSSDGKQLDGDDEILEKESPRLNAWLQRIKQRSKLIDEEVARYNAACSGDLPPDQVKVCDGWRQRGNQCVALHNGEVDRYNAAARNWNTRRNALRTKGDDFRARVKKWEDENIAAFIKAVTKALDDAGWTRVRIQAQGADMATPGGASQSIVQSRPVCLTQGLTALANVQAALTTRQYGARDQALLEAANFMKRAASAGGVGPSENRFQNRPADPPDARIDVTVFKGLAFVDCSAASVKGGRKK